MVVLLGIISAGFVVLAINFIFFRLMFELRFLAIQKELDQSPLFRRKTNHLRKIEQVRHIRYLLYTCLMMALGLMLVIGSFLVLVDDHQRLKMKNAQLEMRVEGLEYQQEQLVLSIPLKMYPKEGIGLHEYRWDKLAGENKDSDLQKQMESAISQATDQYFGFLDTTVSLAVPKTISLQLRGQTDDQESKKTIQKNIDSFAKEAEGLPKLTDIHVRMIISVGKEKKVIYSVNYSREVNEETFNKKNVSEQNLKNDGEKG